MASRNGADVRPAHGLGTIEARPFMDECKGVHVVGDDERDAIIAACGDVEASVSGALAAALGGGTVSVEALTSTGDGRRPSGIVRERPDFSRVMILRWTDQADDGGDPYLHLLDKDRMVGEVYAVGDGFRWHCKTSDFRRVEDTLQEAKDAFVADYCQDYANRARDEVLAASRMVDGDRQG